MKANGQPVQPEERLQYEPRVNAALAALYGSLISAETSVASIARLVLGQARTLTESEHGVLAVIAEFPGPR